MYYKKRETEEWHGVYRGVNFEINKFKSFSGMAQSFSWTHYLWIHLNRIPETYTSLWLKGKKDERFGRVHYDYHKNEIINGIEFHGGCTWYSKEYGFDGDKKVIKIGCDYQHLWDEGRIYSLEYVLSEVKKSIDSFISLVPDYKYRCCGNGKLYSHNEGIEKDGSFYSMEYYGKEQWFADKLKEVTSN